MSEPPWLALLANDRMNVGHGLVLKENANEAKRVARWKNEGQIGEQLKLS